MPWQVVWGDYPKIQGKAMQGLIMVDTGAAIMMLTKKYAEAYSLIKKEKVPEYILGANGTIV